MSYKKIIAILQKRLDAYIPTYETPTWGQYWQNMSMAIPEYHEDKLFRVDQENGYDALPMYDGESWSSVVYAFDHVRDETGLYIVVNEGDVDGNWDVVEEIRENNFEENYNTHLRIAEDFFKGWCEYHLWCAKNGGADPLKQFINTNPSVEDHIEAVIDHLMNLYR